MSTIGAGNASTRLPKLISDDYSSFPFAGYDVLPYGVSVPTRYVYFIANDNSIQRAGTLGVDFSVVNPSDKQVMVHQRGSR
jgi:hypothetical protein